jgi:ribosomal-protein-alanine N-acetyltransferase
VSAESQQQLRVHIRWMIRRDMAEVLDIERGSFEFPWFEEDFIHSRTIEASSRRLRNFSER